jgi:hypothetical protein
VRRTFRQDYLVCLDYGLYVIDFCLLGFEIAIYGFNSFELIGHFVNLEILYQIYYSF